MFRASSAHLQEDTVVHMRHMVLSLSMRVLGGLSVHSLSEKTLSGAGVAYRHVHTLRFLPGCIRAITFHCSVSREPKQESSSGEDGRF